MGFRGSLVGIHWQQNIARPGSASSFEYCSQWKSQQKILWAEVRRETVLEPPRDARAPIAERDGFCRSKRARMSQFGWRYRLPGRFGCLRLSDLQSRTGRYLSLFGVSTNLSQIGLRLPVISLQAGYQPRVGVDCHRRLSGESSVWTPRISPHRFLVPSAGQHPSCCFINSNRMESSKSGSSRGTVERGSSAASRIRSWVFRLSRVSPRSAV